MPPMHTPRVPGHSKSLEHVDTDSQRPFAHVRPAQSDDSKHSGSKNTQPPSMQSAENPQVSLYVHDNPGAQKPARHTSPNAHSSGPEHETAATQRPASHSKPSAHSASNRHSPVTHTPD
jgi:hypothetical protein